MQQIINFLIRNKNSLLFLFLLFLSLIFTLQSHSYHKSKFISSTNFLTGGIYGWQNSVSQYFGLRSENERLLTENERLRNLLSTYDKDTSNVSVTDTISFSSPFTFIKANVYRNDYSKRDNYLLLNRGRKEDIPQSV